MKRAVFSVIVFAVALLAVTLIGRCSPYDDSDTPPKRSGFVIHRDGLTGCEYLTRPGLFSFLTGFVIHPRMGADGRQVCRKN